MLYEERQVSQAVSPGTSAAGVPDALFAEAPAGPPPRPMDGPFGPRNLIYADFTASGRSLPAVERAFAEIVLPSYGNTHSEASHTGGRTTRLREEAREGNEPRRAVAVGIQHAGPTVAAAAVILAGTFAVLVLSPMSFLAQIGFGVAIGILLSAFVVSTFFVPAVTALIGHAAWWPGHQDRARNIEPPAEEPYELASRR